MRTAKNRKDVANMPYLKGLLNDLYTHNGSGLVIKLYKARTGQTLVRQLVNKIAIDMGLRATSAARAAAIRAASKQPHKPQTREPDGEKERLANLSRRFLSYPAPPELRGKHYYGQKPTR